MKIISELGQAYENVVLLDGKGKEVTANSFTKVTMSNDIIGGTQSSVRKAKKFVKGEGITVHVVNEIVNTDCTTSTVLAEGTVLRVLRPFTGQKFHATASELLNGDKAKVKQFLKFDEAKALFEAVDEEEAAEFVILGKVPNAQIQGETAFLIESL